MEHVSYFRPSEWINVSHFSSQVPHAELATWLVQREPDPLPMRCPDQPSPLERDPAGEERDHTGSPVEPRGGPGTLQEEEVQLFHWHFVVNNI